MSDGEDQNPLDAVDMADVYAAGSLMEADRIVAILGDEDVEAVSREISVSKFPSTATQSFLIVAREGDKARAQELIRQAIADGVLPNDGTFL